MAARIEPMRARVVLSDVHPAHDDAMTSHAPKLPPTDWDSVYDEFVARLRERRAGSMAPQLGGNIDPFVLPDSMGRYTALADLLGKGPIVLSFMRGGWCPYCKAELRAWADAMPRLEAVGGRFIAVSGEVGGRAETTRCELSPGAAMLCDVDHGLATALGLTIIVPPGLRQRYIEHGLDLAAVYGDSGQLLPIPATFVIDGLGMVRYAFVEPDFRIRADPAVVIAVVEAITAPMATPAP